MTGAMLNATSRTSLGLLLGIMALPLLSLAGYFVADGLASDRSVAQVMLSLPVAGIVGVAVGALAPHPKLAWRLLAALVCLVGVPIWVIFGLALGGSLSSATSTAALDRFDIEQGFLLVAWQLLVLHLICTALAAGGLLAGRWVRARRMLHQRPR